MILRKKMLTRVLVGMLVAGNMFSQVVTMVHATPAASATADATKEQTEEEKKKEAEEAKQKDIARLQGITIESNNIEGWPEGPATTGESAIVMDMTTGAVLYAKEADVQKHPASITKILTALVALENNPLDKKITVTQENLDSMESGASMIGLKAGEEVTEEQGLYATMLASANEAAYAVAESTTGSYEEFLTMMNNRAKELGCKNSNFCNANGLNDDAHVTTARDMALIARAAYQNEEFRKIIATLEYNIPNTNIVQTPRVFQQHHKMILQNNSNYYQYATGGKTGFTSAAGNTLVTFAEKDGMKLVAVVLKEAYQSHYADTRNILEYCFNNFTHVSIGENAKSHKFDSVVNQGCCVTLPAGEKFQDLTEKVEATGTQEDGLGRVTYTYKEQPVGCAKVNLSKSYMTEIYGDKEAEAKAEKAKSQAASEKNSMKLTNLPVLYYVVAAAWLIVLILLVVGLVRVNMRKKGSREE